MAGRSVAARAPTWRSADSPAATVTLFRRRRVRARDGRAARMTNRRAAHCHWTDWRRPDHDAAASPAEASNRPRRDRAGGGGGGGGGEGASLTAAPPSHRQYAPPRRRTHRRHCCRAFRAETTTRTRDDESMRPDRHCQSRHQRSRRAQMPPCYGTAWSDRGAHQSRTRGRESRRPPLSVRWRISG